MSAIVARRGFPSCRAMRRCLPISPDIIIAMMPRAFAAAASFSCDVAFFIFTPIRYNALR